MTDRAGYDLMSPRTLANPYPVYEAMRAEAPVYYTFEPEMQQDVWLLTRYDDCVNFLKDARFGKDHARHFPPVPGEHNPWDEGAAAINRHMLMADPPDHTRLRGLVSRAFTPRMIENLEPRIERIADDLLDAVQAQGSMDLIADFALPLPITVIAELLGIPVEDRQQFKQWSNVIVFEGLRGEDREAVGAAALEFIMYFHELFARRRAEPRDDLVSALVAVEEQGDVLSQQELLSMVFLLLVAGHETTVNLIGNGTLALLRHPDQLRRLRENPSLMKGAVEEMLRYDGPVGYSTHRWALEDVTIRGQTIRRGDMVLGVLLAANRDPAEFPEPDLFEITRSPNRHIAFGHGIHYCLGAPLARLEGCVAFRKLLHRLPELALAADPDNLEWIESRLIHGLTSLPVRF